MVSGRGFACVLRMLTPLDHATLGAYCIAFARWCHAEQVLAEMAARDHVTHGLLIKNQDGGASRNPLTKIAADAARVAHPIGDSRKAPRRHV